MSLSSVVSLGEFRASSHTQHFINNIFPCARYIKQLREQIGLANPAPSLFQVFPKHPTDSVPVHPISSAVHRITCIPLRCPSIRLPIHHHCVANGECTDQCDFLWRGLYYRAFWLLSILCQRHQKHTLSTSLSRRLRQNNFSHCLVVCKHTKDACQEFCFCFDGASQWHQT
jgi:hypothetical protein